MIETVLLDLDETLLHDEASTKGAMSATLADAAALRGLDAAQLAQAVLAAARRLWAAGPHHAWCRAIGISSGEGLWATFALGGDPDTIGLRAFAPAYRRAAWAAGLQAAGVTDDDLVADLAERYVWERASRQILFPEALATLVALRARGRRLVLVTNGDRDLQRRKAVACGVAGLMDHVVISGELGIGKPRAEIFAHALSLAGATPAQAVMVGDSLGRDVRGAAAAGVRAVWLDRGGSGERPEAAWAVLPDLAGLPGLLEDV